MVFENFRLNCLLRALLLLASSLLLAWLLLETRLYASAALVGLLTAGQTWALIRYVEKTGQHLTQFLQAVRYGDLSGALRIREAGPAFRELDTAFQEVFEVLRAARSEKEEHYHYLQTVIQHVGVGLLCYQPDGRVELANRALQTLLGVREPGTLEDLRPVSAELVEALRKIGAGEKALVRVERGSERLQLAMRATSLRMRGRLFTLVSVQNIHSELEEKEMEAWQNLVRVLTHEIMNSITPISSLASTADSLSARAADSEEPPSRETLRDISDAVGTIHRRSQGLLRFVDNYRKLTRLPKPEIQRLPVRELFERVAGLMRAELEQAGVRLACLVEPERLELTADPELIEQVLINLVTNSLQALKEQTAGRVTLSARLDGASGRVLIQVADNGPGIPPESCEQIFIPFFTTRRHGSGIGLSLSRQIMRLHHGTITVHSEPGRETVFTLQF